MSPRTGLPIEAIEGELRAALAADGAAVVSAPPGSGKTTVVPLMLLDEAWRDGKILMLEPRRIATRAAARRMADLVGGEVGEQVGYVTRTDRRTGPAVDIEVVTEGVLTRRLQRDPTLPGVAAVIFDEVHERNLQTDLGLALLLDARAALRPDLRVVAMSATVDQDRLAALLGGRTPAPVVEAAGRLFPVDVRWQPLGRARGRLVEATAASVLDLLTKEQGDILVFLPGIGEINRVAAALGERGAGAEIHRLHGSLDIAEQDAALLPTGVRKVVLATDIAESSLTVEGVSIVVDSGLARAPRFDPRTGMTRLTTISISKASAEQRAGRAGRTGPGVAVRLWSKMEHGARPRHIEPEILSVDLAGLVLDLAAWGVTGPGDLPFLDQPPRRTWQEAVRLLAELGAIDSAGRLTTLGQDMAQLPLHPRLGAMVAGAGADQPLAIHLAALLEDRDIFRGPPDELPVDLGERLRVLAGESHPRADRRAVDRVRRAARDLARRAGVPAGATQVDGAGRVLALGYRDRLAFQRGGPGRYQLRTGTTAWMNQTDPLGLEPFVIAAELDGKRKDARMRLAAAIEPAEVAELFGEEISRSTELVWEGDRLVARTTRRLGGISLDIQDAAPTRGPEVAARVVDRVRRDGLGRLGWTRSAAQLRDRVRHLHSRLGDPWPDWSDEALMATLEDWLEPQVAAVTDLNQLKQLDVARLLSGRLDHRLRAQLDKLAPPVVTVPSGRRVSVDYSGAEPRISVAVQEMFGAEQGPTVAGEPVVLELLSPARRPVQVTSDLGGFWDGSWHEVRKDMAGRYPKHEWPVDPRSAAPVRK